jgi:WD40-like Beta Propeller Repeat
MRLDRFFAASRGKIRMAAMLLAALIALASLAGCGSEAPVARVVLITATFTPGPAVIVVTATPSPEAPAVDVVPDTPVPQPTETTQVVDTLPSATPDQVLTAQAILTAFATPEAPSTDTPVPPTVTPAPTAAPKPTGAPKPTAAPKASLNSYGVIYSNFDPGPETDEFKYSVWVMRGDGSEAKEVFRPAVEPAYSLNGQKVAFYRPFNGIWVYDVATETVSHVVVSDYAEYPSFSPDGSQLVFHEFVGTYWSMDGNLYVARADGSERHQILDNAIRPSWAPKGNLIVFDTCRGTSCGIFVVQPNGQGFRQVVSDGGGKASWSPDGKKIIYSAEANGNSEIFVVNLDGSGRKQLTQNTGNDTLPAYSPDGQYIFFLSDQNGKAWAIRVMRPDGSDIKTIRQIGVPPRWQFSRLDVDWW